MEGGVVGTILGSVLGFLGALLPHVFELLQAKFKGQQSQPQQQHPEHEEGVVENEPVPANLSVSKKKPVAVDDEDEDVSYGPAIQADFPIAYMALDMLRASVRPVLTYAFFLAYIGFKFVIMQQALAVDHVKAVELLPVLWDEGTEALFAAVVSFWFGSRAMVARKRK